VGGETPELVGVVSGNDAVGRAGELNHAEERGDVCFSVGGIKRGAGAAREKILVKVAIVRG